VTISENEDHCDSLESAVLGFTTSNFTITKKRPKRVSSDVAVVDN